MPPSGSSARGRSPVTKRDFRKGRDDLVHTTGRVDQLEKKLHTVGDLAVQTAQEVAVLRSELQIVFLASGSAITRLTEELAAYNEGKAAVAHGTAERGPPLKVRLYRKLLQCVEAQAEPFPATRESVQALCAFDPPWALSCQSQAVCERRRRRNSPQPATSCLG